MTSVLDAFTPVLQKQPNFAELCHWNNNLEKHSIITWAIVHISPYLDEVIWLIAIPRTNTRITWQSSDKKVWVDQLSAYKLFIVLTCVLHNNDYVMHVEKVSSVQVTPNLYIPDFLTLLFSLGHALASGFVDIVCGMYHNLVRHAAQQIHGGSAKPGPQEKKKNTRKMLQWGWAVI